MKVDNIVFTPESKSDLEYWRSIQAWKTMDRIKALINGYGGIGKPEPLKEKRFQGSWSKRINKEHRLIFRIRNNTLEIVSCRTHYGK